VLKEADAYLREKRAYERLKGAGVRTVRGFNVPQLLGCDDALPVIEMTIVQRPFVLDFAGAYLDVRPELACVKRLPRLRSAAPLEIVGYAANDAGNTR
jgi:hypothetical protein